MRRFPSQRVRLSVGELEGRTVPAAGALDPSFSSDGKAFVSVVPYQADTASDVLIQADGKIVLAGNAAAFSSNSSPLLARLNSDGTLDNSFSSDGIEYVSISGDTGQFYKVVQQQDGKLVAVGAESLPDNHDHIMVVRFNVDGTLDTTFNGTGIYFDATPASIGWDVAVQPDGKIVVAGVRGTVFSVLRLNEDGSLDTSFSGSGIASIGSGPGVLGPRALVLQPDGRIVVGGSSASGGFGVVRFNLDGSLDTSFSSDGIVQTFPPNTQHQRILGMALQSDGKLVAAGDCGLGQNNSPTPVLLRYNTDGSLDTSLNGTGYAVTYLDSGAGSGFDAVVLQSDGKILAGGGIGIPGGANALLIRYNSDGSIDQSFGPPGLVFAPGILVTDMAPGDNDGFKSIVMTADGRIVAAGTAGGGTIQQLGVARYFADGPFSGVADEYSVGEDSQITMDAPGVFGNDIIIQGNPHVELVDAPSHSGVFNLNSDGSFDYSPVADFNGTDTFTYKLVDGTDSSLKTTVTLTVQPANDPPVAVDDAYKLPIDSPSTYSSSVGVVVNDLDIDGDVLHATLVDAPFVGTLDLHDDGSFTFAFPPDFAGPATFTYQVSDGTVSGTIGTVTLTREGFITVDGDTLKIVGTVGSDIVRVRPVATGILVEMNTPVWLIRQVFRPGAGTPRFNLIDISLGSGNDRLDTRALSIPVRAVAGAGDDVLRTGTGADKLYGDEIDGSGTGADWITSGAGVDSVNGGGGANVISAGNGADLVVAGDGDNSIDAGNGNDSVTVGDGRNEIDGGCGNDTVAAGSGGSFIDGSSGNDLVTVAGGFNWIQGGSGSDILIGGTGNDILEGESGKDLLIGGPGADLLEGGSGCDMLFDGTVALTSPGTDSLAAILVAYVPANMPALQDISTRLSVTSDTGNSDTLTGGSGTDWFWTIDGLDVLDIQIIEPKNAIP